MYHCWREGHHIPTIYNSRTVKPCKPFSTFHLSWDLHLDRGVNCRVAGASKATDSSTTSTWQTGVCWSFLASLGAPWEVQVIFDDFWRPNHNPSSTAHAWLDVTLPKETHINLLGGASALFFWAIWWSSRVRFDIDWTFTSLGQNVKLRLPAPG